MNFIKSYKAARAHEVEVNKRVRAEHPKAYKAIEMIAVLLALVCLVSVFMQGLYRVQTALLTIGCAVAFLVAALVYWHRYERPIRREMKQ